MKKKLSALFLSVILMITIAIPVMAAGGTGTEKWIDAGGTTAEPKNSRDVRNNTNGFGTRNYTPISYQGNVSLYAQNYGYNSGDNHDIKLFIASGGSYTQVGRLYGEGDKLQVEVFNGHSITLVWQRHQMDNRYYVVQLNGPIAKTYVKDFKGKDTGYTSGNVYVRYNGTGSDVTPPAPVEPLKIAVFRAGWSDTYKLGNTINLAARGEGGTAPYRYQFYVLRSNGSRVNFRRTPVSSNTYPWTPVTPDTYTLGVDVYDASGKKVSQEKKITVQGGDAHNNPAEKWIDAGGTTAKPQNSRDVRNNTNGFGTRSYTPISYQGNVSLYAQNYGYNSGDNHDIKLFIASGGGYTQVGRLYGEGDKLQVEVFNGHSITLVWQRHQMDNRYYVVQLNGPIAKTYVKDFKGKDTGYTSGNVYVRYNGTGSDVTPPAQVEPLKIAVFRAGWSDAYRIGNTINLAARGEGGTAPYRYQFYVLRSNGSRVNFRRTPVSSNIYPWTPVTPDTYTLGVDIYDANGNKVSQEKTITVLAK